MTQLIVVVVFLFAWCSSALAFPSEEEVRSNLRAGLTAEEVVRMFGEPTNGRMRPCLECTLTYIPPLGSLTAETHGYTGVKIRFANGRVSDWHVLSGNPSYAEPQAPRFFWPYLKFLGLVVLLGSVTKLLIRFTPVTAVVADEVTSAFRKREITIEKAPPEFRFITHQTTLEEVIAKAGKPSRVVRVPIAAESESGNPLASTKTPRAVIVTYEYALPYHAAVIVMPEYPFEMQNRIRAVFYRPIQRELSETTD